MKRLSVFLLIALFAVFSVNAARVQVNNVPATISNLIVNLTSIFTPSAAQVIDAVGDTILANATIVELNPDANHTLTSTPHIADGTEGQIVIITTDPTEANTVTIQDQGTLGGSNILLLNSIASRTIGAGSSIGLRFNGADWEEVWYNSQIDISTDTNLVGGTNITLSDDTLNVDDAFLVNDASDTMTGDLTLNNADPALIFDPTTADTEFYIAINEDAGDDDDDTFTIGKGVTKGTTPFMTWDKDGGFIAQNLADAVTGYQWLDSNGGTPILNIDTDNERVGIGTATPRVDLDVIGTINIDGGSGILPPTVAAPLQIAVDANGRAFVLSRTGAEYVDFVAGGALKGMRGFGTIDFTIENAGDIFFAPGAGEKLRINSSGELSGDPLDDQFSEMLIGDILSQATTPPGLWVLGLTPATTEPDQGAPPASAHDATYNNFTTSDQVAKSLAWTLNFFDGGDEYLNVADDPAFSWDDSGANPFSMCAWIEVIDTAAIQTVIAKYDVQNTLREWKFVLDAAEKLELALYDESANVESTNITDAALSVGWHFIVHTYDSTGGAAALSDANSVWYVDGIAVAESQSNDGAYVAMEDLAADVTIGGYDTGAAIGNFFQGNMGVVWLEDVELTALQVWLYYKMLKGYYHE